MTSTGRRVGRPRNDERPPGHPGTASLILDAATGVFARSSYERATIGDIATAAGVAHGTVYAHFSSKAELFLAVMRRALRDLEAGWRGGDDDPGPEMIVAMVDRFLDPGAAPLRALVLEHYHAAAHDDDVMRLLTAFNEQSRTALADLIERWRAEGLVDPPEVSDVVAQQITTELVGLCVIEKVRPDVTTDREWRSLLHRHLTSLLGA